MSKIKTPTLSSSKKICMILTTVFVLCFTILISLRIGSIDISFKELIDGMFLSKQSNNFLIIRDLRMPRVLSAVLIGGNLAVAGALLQTTMKNPLADPGIIGISSGASLGAIAVMVIFTDLIKYKIIIAFIGGIIAACLVYLIGEDKGFSPVRIILAGVCVNSILNALSSMVTVFNSAGVSSIQTWLLGSLVNITWNDFKILALYTIVGIALCLLVIKSCDLMGLGDKTAQSLGLNVNRVRVMITFVAVFLTSISTGVGGVISFVGLVIPHICRFLIGSSHKFLIPFSYFMGGFLLLVADTVSRNIFRPYEIPVGLTMCLVGGPFFIYILRRSKR
ncbi:iron complex transport system permease protein [Intestinibacter bartlettii DSM 16795]|jgi:iron complex transport system permease protein|nr:iron ABC transporter permease [Intestinibacter bartlettii]EDQ96017.1 iron chelate uptake ABC transporter, FeCT family, permease protein [Intestinibacter bartlettii DSM 16795]UWO79961.1 iron ABC transporter permease [Intestinibacter bartlettii]SKA51495.1 iron complex transport system permease protein [Intestinibacter bartlettii DSM 16795]